MSRPLRILHLEDDPQDAELVAAALQMGGLACEVVRVDAQEDFEYEVRLGIHDVILSDHKLPTYDGASALAFARRSRPEVPFLLVSGAVGEEVAVGSLLAGATDYVLKDRLSRLVPALQRALREGENWRARRRAEEALQASEQRYRRLFEASKDGILLIEAGTGRIVDANPSVIELLGHPAQHLLGRTLVEIGACGGDEATASVLRDLPLREYARYPEVRLVTRNHQTVDVELVASAYSVDAQRIIQLNVRDVSERRRLEDELRQSQKLEAVGRLAGGVAHDFNNLLVVINSYTELVIESLPPEHPLHADLVEVRKAGVRAARLTSQLLAFSRKQMLRPVVCSLNTVVTELEKMLRRVIGEDVVLRLRLAHDLGNVLADPGQIEQVLMNLVVNSRDAMEKGGTLIIETANRELTAGNVKGRADLKPGAYVCLSVTDTGIGMDEATMRRMFEPFFTTKNPGKGTGLGLSTVYGIVKQSGGYIDVESQVGRGTRVRIFFPLHQGSVPAPPSGERSIEAPSRASETILLVEDEVSVRRLVERVLRPLGYAVLVASSGLEALALAEDHVGPIDLLLTDVVLPGMDGCELTKSLIGARPTMKVMYMSGYAAEVGLRLGATDEPVAFIEKPFTIAEFLRRVRSVLADRK